MLTMRFGLFILSGNYKRDFQNLFNLYFQPTDTNENIGIFWYLYVEIFKQH